MKRQIINILSFVLLLASVVGVFSPAFCVTISASASDATARPSNSGYLSVKDGRLYSENGDPVQLRGVSTHGLLYYPKFVNAKLIQRIKNEWDCNLLRLAAYSETYCAGNEEETLNLLFQGIDYAIDNNMYVIADWHILNDNDPNTNMSRAVEFFSAIGRKYGKIPNIIYEICNEPNGGTTWDDIRDYASCVIPVIRHYNDSSVIIVGTPEYDRQLRCAVEHPIDHYENIMYAFHFYASSHGEEMRKELTSALDAGLPVFISECGISPESGNGKLDYEGIATWFGLVNERNLSYSIWSLSNKNESSAMFVPGLSAPEKFTDKDLTESGRFTRGFISGEDPTALAQTLERSRKDSLLAKLDHSVLHKWAFVAGISLLILAALILTAWILGHRKGSTSKTYPKLLKKTAQANGAKHRSVRNFGKVFLVLTTFCSLIYLLWRCMFSIPVYSGAAAIVCNIILLIIELWGFADSFLHYISMLGLKEYPLPQVDGEYPDVDVFIATYNEPVELLRKTVYACTQMDYPDHRKVHIYICDDKRRPAMRALAEEMGVNYFDRPDNKGAKAGNLNAALARTSSPYIVTFDADMIPMRGFLMQTIPYFMDAEIRNRQLPEAERMPLGFIQTPQCFYSPDVFQYNLYNETRIPNEQDFFYRTIEPAKTEQNSVIYGGSNTILAREALNAIGGFYTETITEDFATGMLIEAAGFISLGLPTPLASGLSASSFKEHIQQRTRWGRGVISTAKHLRFFNNKRLSLLQKLSYFSSVSYWYSPLKNLIYILAPMAYAVFAVPIFVCNTQELALFWLPMLICQSAYMPLISRGALSYTWSGIQEISVMPSLLLPILKETFGGSLTAFKVTDKSKKAAGKVRNTRDTIPFLILIVLSVLGIIRVCIQFRAIRAVGLVAVLFWLLRNLYFSVMALFLIDGRATDTENTVVRDAEPVSVTDNAGKTYEGITTRLTEHNISTFLDESEDLRLGRAVKVSLMTDYGTMDLNGTVVGVKRSNRSGSGDVFTIEILDFGKWQDHYVYHLYNRVPSLPQNLRRNVGPLANLWINFTRHISE